MNQSDCLTAKVFVNVVYHVVACWIHVCDQRVDNKPTAEQYKELYEHTKLFWDHMRMFYESDLNDSAKSVLNKLRAICKIKTT